MKYVDTNVLIRLLTDDVPALRKQAQAWVEASSANELNVPDTVFSELFFVLENNPLYQLARTDVCERLSFLLEVPAFTYSTEAGQALSVAREHPELDFTDCLLATYADNKTSRLLSFDNSLLKVLA